MTDRTLTKSSDGSGKARIFVVGEGWWPSQAKSELIERCAGEVLPRLEDWLQPYYSDHKKRLAFDLDYAERFLKRGQSVLEIGAFPYLLTVPLLQAGFRMTALDKFDSREHVQPLLDSYCISSLNCDLDVDEIPAEDASFDAVIMNEVFEHLRGNLIASMREIHRVLRADGLLMMSTPNLRSVRGICNLLFQRKAYVCMGDIYENYASLETKGIMGHVREYTPTELIEFTNKVGFRTEGVIYRGCYSGGFLWHMADYFVRLRPEFKPFFSLVLRRISA
jgi:2-polyprenyl-3-methyl-5-hydroxy-6-metoxy-1,4-benzoquinol methylase